MPLNMLFAYPYADKRKFEVLLTVPAAERRLIVDSGAFTAWNTGRPVTMDGYCGLLDALKSNGVTHDAVQLDVIHDPEASYANLQHMLERGYKVLPVFTRGEKIEHLERLYALNNWVLLGGVATGAGNKEYVDSVMPHVGDRKMHWLGFCRMERVKHWTPFSMDSSSWLSGCRFGIAHFYEGFGKTLRVYRKAIGHPSAKAVAAWKRMGFAPEELTLLQTDAAWTRMVTQDDNKRARDGVVPSQNLAAFATACAFVQLSQDVERRLRTRYYLAFGATWCMETLVGAYYFLRARGVLRAEGQDADNAA